MTLLIIAAAVFAAAVAVGFLWRRIIRSLGNIHGGDE